VIKATPPRILHAPPTGLGFLFRGSPSLNGTTVKASHLPRISPSAEMPHNVVASNVSSTNMERERPTRSVVSMESIPVRKERPGVTSAFGRIDSRRPGPVRGAQLDAVVVASKKKKALSSGTDVSPGHTSFVPEHFLQSPVLTPDVFTGHPIQ
jgi:hypothetical protein